jgi:D-tyrosyl-tRNA(Tyr) deacylase
MDTGADAGSTFGSLVALQIGLWYSDAKSECEEVGEEILYQMRAILQRVQQGAVSVDGQVSGRINTGLVILVGTTHQDTVAQAKTLARKAANLRIFEDEAGKMNLSALEVDADALIISQFTLFADCRRGRRPSFIEAARPEVAEPLIEHFIQALKTEGERTCWSKFTTMDQ